MTSQLLIKVYGRKYEVVACFAQADEAAANAFMAANPQTGLIAVEDGKLYIANLKDKGVPA